ncbi:MAG TPA: CDP-alcohol phosphatidyltransferase family protein [Thermoanaerobaculales bacterium]|nr:CDP-alcohol phosphatidyltransferase family protein [Thermoanaerobaculales bacterium]HPA82701.1 CDP-alcohol phosphatidyltransferase family protein [Thermoanaerobaculales bacterium]HQL31511.1 CDP-alcohol phosphatidyltransferase family protein [Thermoanaerobaculales bacterium]HQN96963.1 CDP-alcohol phosphatidyltransferase family protein [Thermoanaerobaculales bacterium]
MIGQGSGPERRERIRSKVEEKLRPLTLPNFITLFRMAITPFLVLAINDRDFQLALWILIVGGITDAVDGWLARSLNSRSVIGAFLDPIADKLMLTVAYVSLTIPQGQAVVIPLWLAIMALFRDFLIVLVAVVLYAVEGVKSFPPSILGKATTFMHVVTVCIVLLANLVAVQALTLTVCFYASFALVILSGFNYLYRASKFIEAARQERNGAA